VGGEWAIGQHGPDWIVQRHILREQGLALAGPPPTSLIDPVGADDLRRGVQGTLEEWWAPQLDDPHRLQSREYQAYATLTMCRALYTLHHGAIAPKPLAARWAQQVLDERWKGLIERALAWPEGRQPDEFEDTLSFIRETVGRARKFQDDQQRTWASNPLSDDGTAPVHWRTLQLSGKRGEESARPNRRNP